MKLEKLLGEIWDSDHGSEGLTFCHDPAKQWNLHLQRAPKLEEAGDLYALVGHYTNAKELYEKARGAYCVGFDKEDYHVSEDHGISIDEVKKHVRRVEEKEKKLKERKQAGEFD